MKWDEWVMKEGARAVVERSKQEGRWREGGIACVHKHHLQYLLVGANVLDAIHGLVAEICREAEPG